MCGRVLRTEIDGEGPVFGFGDNVGHDTAHSRRVIWQQGPNNAAGRLVEASPAHRQHAEAFSLRGDARRTLGGIMVERTMREVLMLSSNRRSSLSARRPREPSSTLIRCLQRRNSVDRRIESPRYQPLSSTPAVMRQRLSWLERRTGWKDYQPRRTSTCISPFARRRKASTPPGRSQKPQRNSTVAKPTGRKLCFVADHNRPPSS